MLPVQEGWRGAFTVPLLLSVLALMHSCSVRSQVIGPSQPIVAFAGDDVVLPCHLEPAVDVSDMLVEWARPDLEPRFVLVWRDGVELQSVKHPSFRGRSSLFADQLKHGNVSLKLSAVKTSDQGAYRCFLPDFSSSPMIQLLVGVVSSAVVQTTRSSGGVLLQCESAGWYPEPELLWLDTEGRVLPAGQTETLRRPDGLYNVSSRVTVERRHGSSFTCRVQQQSIEQSRDTRPWSRFMDMSEPRLKARERQQQAMTQSSELSADTFRMSQRKVQSRENQHEREKELHVVQQKDRKRKLQEEETTLMKLKEHHGEPHEKTLSYQNNVEMEEVEVNKEPEDVDELEYMGVDPPHDQQEDKIDES